MNDELDCEDGSDLDIEGEMRLAAYRTAAKQIAKTVRAPLVAAMKREGASASQLKVVQAFLETERGLAVLSIVLGFVIRLLPTLGNDEKIATVARALRVGGLQQFSDDLADLFTEPLRKALVKPLQKLDALPD